MPLPPLADFPTAPVAVTVVFRGLLTFCFDGKNLCEVGVFKSFPTGHEHNLVFRKWEKKDGKCPAEPAMVYAMPTSKFELVVNKPLPAVDGVFIKGKDPFDRLKSTSDPQDFRWMVDFEKDLYPTAPVNKDGTKVSPRLIMKKGIFYTHQKTLNTFNGVPSTGVGDVRLGGGSVAEVTAARIYLDTGGSVDVFIDNVKVDTLTPAANLEFQIDVYNLCDPSTHPLCEYIPAHPSEKEKRNDFFIYYRAITLGAGEPEYHLMPVLPLKGDNPITGICQRAGEESSDPAPCAGTGYGQTTPPFN
jgi:hypothetical protein